MASSVPCNDLLKPYNLLVTLVLPIMAALALHAAVQIREPYAHHFAAALVLVILGICHSLKNAWHIDIMDAAAVAMGMLGIFTATIACSMTTYRVFFHPLRHIPGPLSCKLSMWSWVLADWDGRRAERIYEMHRKHGDIISLVQNQRR